MKFLVYADLQASVGTEVLFSNPTQSLQSYRVRLFYEKIRQIYEEHECEGLIDAGDTTNDRSLLAIPTIDIVSEGNEMFSGGNNHKILGNHEHYLKDASVHVGRMFKPYFKVYSTIKSVELDGSVLIFVPYFEQSEEYQKIRDEINRHRGQQIVLIGHFQLIGSHMNSGIALTGVDIDLLRGIKLTLLGHIHRPQTLSANVHYIGSPFQQDFGEAGDQNRVGIFDSHTATIKWVPMTGFPIYRRTNLATFLREARRDSEDRWEVTVSSPEEAEQFYAHPLCSRAEPVYSYQARATENAETDEEAPERTVDWSLENSIKRYLVKVDPGTKGIMATTEEMLEYGVHMATGE